MGKREGGGRGERNLLVKRDVAAAGSSLAFPGQVKAAEGGVRDGGELAGGAGEERGKRAFGSDVLDGNSHHLQRVKKCQIHRKKEGGSHVTPADASL
jgi:hypothetical protein